MHAYINATNETQQKNKTKRTRDRTNKQKTIYPSETLTRKKGIWDLIHTWILFATQHRGRFAVLFFCFAALLPLLVILSLIALFACCAWFACLLCCLAHFACSAAVLACFARFAGVTCCACFIDCLLRVLDLLCLPC